MPIQLCLIESVSFRASALHGTYVVESKGIMRTVRNYFIPAAMRPHFKHQLERRMERQITHNAEGRCEAQPAKSNSQSSLVPCV